MSNPSNPVPAFVLVDRRDVASTTIVTVQHLRSGVIWTVVSDADGNDSVISGETA